MHICPYLCLFINFQAFYTLLFPHCNRSARGQEKLQINLKFLRLVASRSPVVYHICIKVPKNALPFKLAVNMQFFNPSEVKTLDKWLHPGLAPYTTQNSPMF